jgi:hypothetical protein
MLTLLQTCEPYMHERRDLALAAITFLQAVTAEDMLAAAGEVIRLQWLATH